MTERADGPGSDAPSRARRRVGLLLALALAAALGAVGLRAWVRPPGILWTLDGTSVFRAVDAPRALPDHFLVHISLGDDHDRHLHRRDGATAWRRWLERWLGPATREGGVDCLARYRRTGVRITRGDEEWVQLERE